MITCLFCDLDHATSACELVHEADVWEEQRPPAPAFMAEGEDEALRRWVAGGNLRPLADALRRSEEEVSVLETVHTDEDQRRRLARARRLVKAARHMRLNRRDEVDAEVEGAEIALPGDARIRIVEGFARLLEDDLERAEELFAAAEKAADADELADARVMLGRTRLALGRTDKARSTLEALVEEVDGPRLAQARYELARCRVAELDDDAVR